MSERNGDWIGAVLDPDLDTPEDRAEIDRQMGVKYELSEDAEPVEVRNGRAPAPVQKPRWPDPVPITALTAEAAKVDWLWHGCIAKEHVTLFAAYAKAGKTTLTSHKYRALQTGIPFVGRQTRKCKTLVITEESPAIWLRRRELLQLTDQLHLLCRPMMGKPTPKDWNEFLLHVRDKAEGFDLVVIDTVTTFAPWRNENDASEVAAALLPLNLLTQAGLAVEVIHHFGKADGIRGSSAFDGAVDILLEFRPLKPDDRSDRRRVLSGRGRFEEIPDEIVLALSDDGTQYTAEGDKRDVTTRELHDAILAALPHDAPGLTCGDIHDALPASGRPRRGDVMGMLQAGAKEGNWQSAGLGTPRDPRRFWRSES